MKIRSIVGAHGRRLGSAPFAGLKKVHVRKLRDMEAATPEAANFRLKQISALYAWAIKNDLATFNSAEKLEKLKSRSDGYYTWTDRDIEVFEAFWPIGSRPRLAMAIMLYLGVRRSDAVSIGRKHESKDGLSVTFAQLKGRKKGASVLALPILPPFRAILDASQLGRETWLETAFVKPYSTAGFGNRFKDWCKAVGLPQCICHGLRKIGAVRAAEAGASEHELIGDVRVGKCRHGARLHAEGGTEEIGCERRGEGLACKANCPTFCPAGRKNREINELAEWWHSLGELNPCFQIENLAS
jgi:integrase